MVPKDILTSFKGSSVEVFSPSSSSSLSPNDNEKDTFQFPVISSTPPVEDATSNESSSMMDSSQTNSSGAYRGGGGGVAAPFPFKLHEMLERVEQDGISHIVNWQPHGRCFCVYEPSLFVKQVMPKYFSQTKFASFQRQLNLYGFQRLSTGRDKGGYYHEHFLRSKPDLVHRLTRQKIKGTKVRRAMTPGMEPSFYGMKFMPPSSSSKEETKTKQQIATTATNTFRTIPSVPSLVSMPSESSSTLRTIPSAASLGSLAATTDSSERRNTATPPIVSSETPPVVTPTFGTPFTQASPKMTAAAVSSSPLNQSVASFSSSSSSPDLNINPIQSMKTSTSTGDLLFFEGKPFHYIDREVMMKIRKPLLPRPEQEQTLWSSNNDNSTPPKQENKKSDDLDTIIKNIINNRDEFTARATTDFHQDVEWLFS